MGSRLTALWAWLGARDRGYSALRRAARAAIIMPAMFAVGEVLLDDPNIGLFAAFGGFALLLMVDFGGPISDRVESMIGLSVAGAVFITVGTLASGNPLLAAVSMLVVGFAVLFAGVVSSVMAAASFSLLLSFILPVCVAGTLADVPARLAGWSLSAVVSVFAVALLWPAPEHDAMRAALRRACAALGERLQTEAEFYLGGAGAPDERQKAAAIATANTACHDLRMGFLSTPYRPTSLSTSARVLVRVVDEIGWLNAVLKADHQLSSGSVRRAVCDVKTAAARCLRHCAGLLEGRGGSIDGVDGGLVDLHNALIALEHEAMRDIPRRQPRGATLVTALEPSFRAREIGFATSMAAHNVRRAAVAEQRSFRDRLLGHQPDGVLTGWQAARLRLGTHLQRHSVWLHNSVRGAIALGVAVYIANYAGLQHSFWVVLGTLSVLRSNALNTGQFAARGIVGTLIGFVVGAGILKAIGTDEALLWVLLPITVFLAGLAPAVISFAAGQAAFTMVLVILFNILQPAGWHIGLVRFEDVTVGCLVSLMVGILFWPRGAAAQLRRTLADAYADSARYLEQAVEFSLFKHGMGDPPSQRHAGDFVAAAAAYRRLDDAFRTYLAERGAKPVPIAAVTNLVSGVTALRLAGTALLDLWHEPAPDGAEDPGNAHTEVRSAAARVCAWYDRLGAGITAGWNVPEPLESDPALEARLADALRFDIDERDGSADATVVRLVWTADHLDALRRWQVSLVEPAQAAAAQVEAPGA